MSISLDGKESHVSQSFDGRDRADVLTASHLVMKFPKPAPIHGSSFLEGVKSVNILDEKSWAYEGVVLPGGKIMVGRWWAALENRVDPADLEPGEDVSWYERLTTGPFMFWCVDRD